MGALNAIVVGGLLVLICAALNCATVHTVYQLPIGILSFIISQNQINNSGLASIFLH